MNIWGLCYNFVECESFLESNLDDSIDFGQLMHGLAVYVKEWLPFA